MATMKTVVTDKTIEVSPFEDPTPALSIPRSSSSNSETNPFRARNSGTPNTPVLSVFPASPTNGTAPKPTSPGPKSKNPFLDIAAEDDSVSKKSREASKEIKDSKDPSQRKYPSSPNGTHSRPPHHHVHHGPRPGRRPDDPNAPRPSSSHRRPRGDPARPSDRDRDRDRYRERRDRPSGEPSRRPRPRSNSESSIPTDRSHHRRKEDGHIHKSRSRPHKDDKKDDKKTSGTSANGKRRLHPVDKIDLLDVTGLYGSHGFFHHDGPFDACRPHRNKQPHKAPVAAFPKDSLTNTLAGGLGEVPGLDRDKYFGLSQQEAFQDYGVAAAASSTTTSRQRRTSDPEQQRLPIRSLKEDFDSQKLRPSIGIRSTSFDPRLKTEPVHGVETVGLGTSTFLEGAPAPKSAIKAVNDDDDEDGGGLSRTKSLVQKIKGRRGTTGAGGDRSPPPLSGPLLASPNGTTSLDSAYNPFFKEGQFVERVESLPTTSNRERADSGGSDKSAGANGLLGRVKSLKISGAGRKGRKSED